MTTAALEQHRLAAGLASDQLDRLAAIARPADWAPGQRVFDEGGQAARLWLITAGQIALDLKVPGRATVIVETLGPGDELGLSWLSPVPRWQFGAVAQRQTSAIEMDSGDLIRLCEQDHELGYLLTRRLLATAVSRLQAARIRILDLYASPRQLPGRTP